MILAVMDQEISVNNQRIPRFMQLADLLQRLIAGGQYLPGDRLPAESQLAVELEVAVGTLRKAMAELERRGLVQRRQGSGTYVKKYQQPSNENKRAAVYQFFRLERLNGGGLPGAYVIDVSRQRCVKTAKLLGIDGRSAHWRIQRIRTLDNLPVAAEQICIAGKHSDSLDASVLPDTLYEYYRENFNLWIVRVEDSVSCGVAPEWFTQTDKGLSGVVFRTAWDQQEKVAEVSTTWFDPALCRYTARWS